MSGETKWAICVHCGNEWEPEDEPPICPECHDPEDFKDNDTVV